MNEYTWADLDASNRTHYGRGKPDHIRQAEIEADLAHDAYQQAVDDYYDNHYGDELYWTIAENLGLCAQVLDAKVIELKRQQYPASEPVITGDQEPEQAW